MMHQEEIDAEDYFAKAPSKNGNELENSEVSQLLRKLADMMKRK